MKKKVSVVVPCYNAARYLKKCTEYLLCQTIGIENMEVILVDDASTDDGETWKVITEFEARYPDSILAVSLGQNMRQGGARNVGVSYASGEYLVFAMPMTGFWKRHWSIVMMQRKSTMQTWLSSSLRISMIMKVLWD